MQVIMKVSIPVFIVSSMLAMGTSMHIKQITAPLSNYRLVIVALAANFVIVPLLALGIAKLFLLDEPLAAGLFVVSICAGAPVFPKLVKVARGDTACAVALMILLVVSTIILLPLLLPLYLGSGINTLILMRSLIILMLIPLSTGLFIKACFESFATVLHRGAKLVEAASLVALFVVIVVLNIQNLKTLFGTLGIAALLVLLWLAISIGYSLGGPSRNTRKVLALGTGQRNIEAAFLVASQGFENQPMVLVIVIVTALISLISVWPMAFWFGRKDPAENVQ